MSAFKRPSQAQRKAAAAATVVVICQPKANVVLAAERAVLISKTLKLESDEREWRQKQEEGLQKWKETSRQQEETSQQQLQRTNRRLTVEKFFQENHIERLFVSVTSHVRFPDMEQASDLLIGYINRLGVEMEIDDILQHKILSKIYFKLVREYVQQLRNTMLDAIDDIEKVFDLIEQNSPTRLIGSHDGYEKYRPIFVDAFSFAIPDRDTCQRIAEFVGSRHVIEVGAGNALWAAIMLNLYQINWTPTDNFSDYDTKQDDAFVVVTEVDSTEAVAASTDTDVLVLIWPSNQNSMAFDALSGFAGNSVVYIGNPDGLTGTDEFHQKLRSEWHVENIRTPHYKSWWMAWDSVEFYTRVGSCLSVLPVGLARPALVGYL